MNLVQEEDYKLIVVGVGKDVEIVGGQRVGKSRKGCKIAKKVKKWGKKEGTRERWQRAKLSGTRQLEGKEHSGNEIGSGKEREWK